MCWRNMQHTELRRSSTMRNQGPGPHSGKLVSKTTGHDIDVWKFTQQLLSAQDTHYEMGNPE